MGEHFTVCSSVWPPWQTESFSEYQIRISLVSACEYWIPSSHCVLLRRIWLHFPCSMRDMQPSSIVSQGPSPKPKELLEKLWLTSLSSGANLHYKTGIGHSSLAVGKISNPPPYLCGWVQRTELLLLTFGGIWIWARAVWKSYYSRKSGHWLERIAVLTWSTVLLLTKVVLSHVILKDI